MLVRMREIGEIHVYDDRAFLRWASRASVVVLLLGCVAAVAWCALVAAVGAAVGRELAAFEIGWGTLFSRPGWWVALVVGVVLSLAVHELVHGFFFRQFAPADAHVTYGANWKRGVLYASAEGVVFTRRQYEVALIAPTIVVTCGLLFIGIGLKWPLWTIIVATLHLSGCTGDWGYLARMRRDPAITHCEDTSFGVRFLSDQPEPSDLVGFDGLDGEPARASSEIPIEIGFGGAGAPASDGRDAARPRLVVLDGGASDDDGEGPQPGSDDDGLASAEPTSDASAAESSSACSDGEGAQP